MDEERKRNEKVLSTFSGLGSGLILPYARCPHHPSHPRHRTSLPSSELVPLTESLNTQGPLNIIGGNLKSVIDNNEKTTPPLEDKLIYLFKIIHFQPIVLTEYLTGAHLNYIKLI